MTESQECVIRKIMVTIFLVSMFFVAREGAACLQSSLEKESMGNSVLDENEIKCVVVDAGHGGNDPGKIGVNGLLEKDLNLIIAKKLCFFLEQEDVQVVMTREGESGLYDENATNKKVQDMKNRISIIEVNHPELVVSIHQNSYHDEVVHGAQVFYYSTSKESKSVAEIIQGQLVSGLDFSNTRSAKGNDSYYLLKKTESPIIIVECGFLSNMEEAELLGTDLYQEKLAWNICLGILKYLNSSNQENL